MVKARASRRNTWYAATSGAMISFDCCMCEANRLFCYGGGGARGGHNCRGSKACGRCLTVACTYNLPAFTTQGERLSKSYQATFTSENERMVFAWRKERKLYEVSYRPNHSDIDQVVSSIKDG